MKSSRACSINVSSPLLGQACGCNAVSVEAASPTRLVIKPMAILEVVRRRGRSWGLLAQYEEARLGISR